MSEFNPYFVQLLPLDKFFFGGEKNFSSMDNESYIVHSRIFPQQTSVLGMIRLQLLLSNGLLDKPFTGEKIKEPETAADIIGGQSFSVDGKNDFKTIGALSPIFIVRINDDGKKEYFWSAPKDTGFVYKEAKIGKYCLIQKNSKRVEKEFVPLLEGYDQKSSSCDGFISNKGNLLSRPCIFGECIQVGITKNRKHFPFIKDKYSSEVEEDSGFFKQIFYTLKKGFAFGVVVWLKEGQAKKLQRKLKKDDKIWLGAERSVFAMNLQEWKEEQVSLIAPSFTHHAQTPDKVVLLSDAWVTPETYQHCRFSFGDTIEFRFLRSSVNGTSHYYKRSSKKGGGNALLKRSHKYNLFERGTVFYLSPDQLNDFTMKLGFPDSFRKIGYNAFAILNNNQHFNYYKP